MLAHRGPGLRKFGKQCKHGVDFALRVLPEVATPDAVNGPAAALEKALPRDVAFTHAASTVVRGAVALDAQAEARGIGRVHDCEVDPVAACAPLRLDVIAALAQRVVDALLE